MKSPRRRLFWRIYLNGLLVIVSAAMAATATTILVQPESRFHGRPDLLYRLMASELALHLNHPKELQATLDRFTKTLKKSCAIYGRDGTDLAKSGPWPPPSLDQESQSKIGGWHPIHPKWGQWVYAASLGGEKDPYLLVQGNESGDLRFALALAAILGVVALISWRMARGLASPLERLTATSRALAGGDLAARNGIIRRDEIGELARALDDMAMRLEERLRSEKELLANISHELRSPLARLRVALELCEDAPGDASNTLERLQGMGVDLAELERLVDNVLTSARLDLAASGPATIPLRLRAVALSDFFLEMAARADRHHPNQPLKINIAPDLPTAMIDPDLLHRVGDNLLDNAFKYSPPNSPVALVVNSRGHRIQVEVTDQGQGVPEEDLPYLFEPFFRSDRSRSRQTGGAGLGLTLSQRIIDAHGGTINARINQDKGMTFSFELPVVKREAKQEG